MSSEAKPAIRFVVGYQLPEGDEESFAEIVRDYRDHVAEVYFPWGDQPSGRAPLAARRGYTDWSAQERLEEDLAALRGMGVGLDLLFNAACYGGLAASRFLANQVVSVIDRLGERVGGIRAVTTTSPAVAHAVKRQFQDIEVRASVNMRIGTVQGMRYLADLFDGYCVQREYNRDLVRLGELKSWADGAGKRLYMLANSGCLAFCSGQTFHDNLVAHEREVDEVENIPDWTPHTCWRLLADRANWPFILQATWVRPEDLHHYEGLFGAVKLATRMHSSPRLVIGAYAARRHRGNLLDLLEPGFAPALAPYVLDNGKFPDGWFEHSTRCGRRCEQCGYCAQVLERILTRMDA